MKWGNEMANEANEVREYTQEEVQSYLQQEKNLKVSKAIASRIGELEIDKINLQTELNDYKEAVTMLQQQKSELEERLTQAEEPATNSEEGKKEFIKAIKKPVENKQK